MTEYIYTEKENIFNIADAIRTVSNTEDKLSFNEMEAMILSLSNNTSNTITNSYEYTYNGDVNDTNNQWVLNGSGHKMYVKLGDLPKGTLNIVGSEISVTNGTNASLNVHFTVTDEHLTRELSMYEGSMVATAV